MNHYYQYLLGALLTAALVPAHAQSVPFTSARIPNKELLKIAQRAIKTGEEDYKASSPRYLAALPHFLEAQKINPNNGGLNLEIGDCYLNMGDKATALPYLQKAAELETGPAAARAHYVLGRAYQLSAHWPEALRPQLLHARQCVSDYTEAFAAYLDSTLSGPRAALDVAAAGRWAEAAAIMTGRVQAYRSEANQLAVPRLPADAGK